MGLRDVLIDLDSISEVNCAGRRLKLRARSCNEAMFLDYWEAFDAVVKGYATWATKILGIPRKMCLSNPIKCLNAAREALLDLDICDVVAADDLSAKCLANIICLGVAPEKRGACVEKIRKLLLPTFNNPND